MSPHSHDHAVAPAEALDPVCGMTISPDDAVGHIDHKGRTYYFCSQSCLDQFRANPDAFLAKLVTVGPLEPFDDGSLLRLVASLEKASEHPLASAIVTGANERGVKLADVANFESITGQGVVGLVESRQVAVGNLKLLESLSVDVATLRAKAEELRRNGQTVMFIAVDRRPAGLVGVADPIKETTREAIDALHREGVKVVMLTGDNRTTAEAVALRL